MTIAACYLSAEGVVLGADSTSSMVVAGLTGQSGSEHYYNFAQKIFEFGDPGSTVGVALWGLGSLGQTSYRTLLAETADEAKKQNLASFNEVARLVASALWTQYNTAFAAAIGRARDLDAKGSSRTDDENREFSRLCGLSGGLCLAGRWGNRRQPDAFEISFGPLLTNAPKPQPLASGDAKFWGWRNLTERLVYGIDNQLWSNILGSPHWHGTPENLFSLISPGVLGQPHDLPLRDAIDWIYASIYTTIKAMKFSHLAPVCGGPIEIAVVSSDRPFRWVRHKELGEAIAAHKTREDRP
jgi:hypothetical protein